MRVALVHDWLTGMRGGEKCLESACRHWPDAPLFSLLHRPGSVSPVIEKHRPRTSLLGWLPGIHRYYRYLLPIFPLTARWPIPDCELLLSFSHCVAKAAKAPPGVPHVCYCFTPMRYIWDMQDAYFSPVKRAALGPLLRRLRDWDRRTADRVTHFIAISRTIQNRIRECYNRDSVLIYPPVDVDFYTPIDRSRENYFLIVSALVPYKRFDLAIAACSRMKLPLIVIGRGPEESRLRSIAGPSVRFLGWQPDEIIREHYRRTQALIFPAEEDFGIVPLEAQACGCPVIAFDRGGVSETVKPATGVFFNTQSVEAVVAAIEQFHTRCFNPMVIRQNALPFSTQRFERELFNFVESVARVPLRKAA